jgi:predicted DNA-binding ribbon-helix-helix protein
MKQVFTKCDEDVWTTLKVMARRKGMIFHAFIASILKDYADKHKDK